MSSDLNPTEAILPDSIEDIAKKIGERAVEEVVNWDDRTSPEDYPDHMLITGDELQKLFERQIGNYFFDNPEALAALCSGNDAEPAAYRWRYPHSDRWTLRASYPGDHVVREPLYLHPQPKS